LCLTEARRWTRSAPEAEDVAQEAVLRAWRMREGCRTPDVPGPWLRRIVRNEALRARERAARHEEKAHRVAREPCDEDTADVNLRVDVRTLLDTLSAEDRALLALRYGGDLTQEGVAMVMGLPEGTVKVRLHRLRSRLSSQLFRG
jgi:RNA polymerase sigma-70 factor (ECF subfamily)